MNRSLGVPIDNSTWYLLRKSVENEKEGKEYMKIKSIFKTDLHNSNNKT